MNGKPKPIACTSDKCKGYKHKAFYMRDEYLKNKKLVLEVFVCPSCNTTYSKPPKGKKWM